MFKKMIAPVSFLALMLVCFLGTAFAAGAVTPDDGSLLDLAKPVLEAVKGGQYWLAASLTLVFACAVARRYGMKRFPFLGSDAGGAALVLLGSFGGATATSLAAGALPSLAMAWTALQIGIMAAGGFSLVKKLIADPIMGSKWYADKCPAWLKPLISIAMWAFTKPAADVAKKAEAAGDAAVKANPAPGTKSTLGDPSDV